MSSTELNVGFLRPNASKSRPTHPDFRGTWTLAGVEVMVSAWWKDKEGEKMLSLSLTDPADLAAHRSSGAQGSPAPAGRGYLYPNGSEAFKGRVSLKDQDYRLSGIWKEQNGEACVEVRSTGSAPARPAQSQQPQSHQPQSHQPQSHQPQPQSPAPSPASPVSSSDLSDLGLGDIFDTE